jgi:hypothetical protein
MLRRPLGRGPFPAGLINHARGRTRKESNRLGPYERMAANIGSMFARHGFVSLFLFRRGAGPSSAFWHERSRAGDVHAALEPA